MNRRARPRRCRRLAIAAVLCLLPAVAFAQSCDLQTLAITLHAGTMPDMRGCPRAVVEQALRATEIRSAIATGPSAVAAGAVYDQDPGPGSAIQPGALATIRVSDGRTKTDGIATDNAAGNGAVANSAADGAVAGAFAGGPAASDAAPASVVPRGSDAPGVGPPNDAVAAGTAPTTPAPADAAPADAAPTDTTPTDITPADITPADPGSADAAPPADATVDGASAGDATADSAITGDTAPGTATDGVATNAVATNGMAATGAAEPGNVPGLVATPAGVQAIVPATEAQASTSVPERVAAMPGWWWIALALALTLVLAGVIALVRQRRIQWQRPAWEQRVHAQAVIVPQGSAMPVGKIPLAAMPFAVAASLGVGEIAVIGDIPTRTQDA